jgi:hypothetical protein
MVPGSDCTWGLYIESAREQRRWIGWRRAERRNLFRFVFVSFHKSPQTLS